MIASAAVLAACNILANKQAGRRRAHNSAHACLWRFLSSSAIHPYTLTMNNHILNTYHRGDQFIKACGFNEAHIIRRLLDEGADVEQEASNPLYRGKFSPLLQACHHGRLDTVRLLLDGLHDTRPPPRHRHALDAPGPGPMAPRGASARAAHRVLPVARAHALGLGGLSGRAR